MFKEDKTKKLIMIYRMSRGVKIRELILAKKRALRLGLWYKINPHVRTIIDLAIKTLTVIKSKILIQIYENLLESINPYKKKLKQAYEIGLKIAKKRIEQALMMGNEKIVEWFKDKRNIICLGLSYLNSPPFYRIAF